MKLDWQAIVESLFLPLLMWIGSVVSISMMGYPNVVCMTPVAWMLALPVGLRIYTVSNSLPKIRLVEAGLAGAILGIWQGLMLPATMAASPYLANPYPVDNLPNPFLVGFVAVIISVPFTSSLSAGTAWLRARNTRTL